MRAVLQDGRERASERPFAEGVLGGITVGECHGGGTVSELAVCR